MSIDACGDVLKIPNPAALQNSRIPGGEGGIVKGRDKGFLRTSLFTGLLLVLTHTLPKIVRALHFISKMFPKYIMSYSR